MSKKLNRNLLTESDKIEDSKALEEFKEKKSKEILKARQRERELEIKDIKSSFRSDRRSKLTTTKIFMYFILINCSVVEIYSMYIMYKLQDLSALISLIGAVVGESISYAIYCAKSFNDSREEARSLLERDKFLAEHNINRDNEESLEDLEYDGEEE